MAIPTVEATQIINITSNSTSTGSVTLTLGTILENDIILAIIAIDGDAASPTATPATYATITSSSEGAAELYYLWKRQGATPDTTITISWTGSEQTRIMLVRVAGCITTGDPWDVISSAVVNANTTTNVLSRLTSTEVDTLAIYAVAVDRNRVTSSETITGTGWTQVGTSGSSSANGAGLVVGENDMPTIVQVEAGTFGTWGTADQNMSRGFNLKGVSVTAILKAVGETLEIPELEFKLNAIKKAITDVLNIPELEFKLSAIKKAVGETLGIPEVANRFRNLFRQVGEPLSIVEVVAPVKKLLRAITELLQVEDSGDTTFSNLQARIKFNDDVLDSSGNNNNGTINGVEAYVDGKLGKAYDFPGNGNILLDNEANFDRDINQPFSWSFWVFAPAAPSASSDMFMIKGDSIGDPGQMIFFAHTSGNVQFRINDGTTSHIINSTVGVGDNLWHLVTCTFSGNSNRSGMKIYLDGVLDVTGTAQAMSGNSLNNIQFRIGGLSDSSRELLNDTLMDDLQIYDKELTKGEITLLYGKGFAHRKLKRAITDVLSIPELEFRFRKMARAVGEVLSIPEVVNRFRTIARAVSEVLTIPEVVGTFGIGEAILKAINEILTIPEVVGKLSSIKKAITDVLSIPEVANRFRQLRRAVNEVLSIDIKNQFSRPDADDAIGVWLNEGNSTPLWNRIDEVIPNDVDLIHSDVSPAAFEVCDISMSSISDPNISTGHILRWRYRKSIAGGRTIRINLKLRQGTTVIVERNFNGISNIIAQDNYTLSAAEADSITDYSDLNFRVFAELSGSGGSRDGRVTWVEFEVPGDEAFKLSKIKKAITEVLTVAGGPVRFDNLQAYIKMNDDVTDSSGNSNNGTVVGSELYTDGKLDKGFDYNGSTRINLANEANFDRDINQPFSWSFWVKADSAPSSSADIFLSKGADIGLGGQFLFFQQTSGFLSIRIHDGTTFHDTLGTIDISDSIWHLVTVTYSGNSNRSGEKIYIDGILDVTGAAQAMAGSSLNNDALTIGALTAGGRVVAGDVIMDDLQIYDDELSAKEVELLYTSSHRLLALKRAISESLHIHHGTNFNEEFSQYRTQTAADTSWDSTDTGQIQVNITNDNLDYALIFDSSDDVVVHDLGAGNVSDTAWVLRGKLRFSTLTNNSGAFFLGLSDGDKTEGSITNQDFLGFMILYRSGNKDYRGADVDEAQPINGTDGIQVFTFLTATDYYFEIKRLSDTTYSTQFFTNADFETGSLGLINSTCTATLDGLQYIKLMNQNVTSGGTIVGTLDDISFWNGVTDATPRLEASKLSAIKKAIKDLLQIRDASTFTDNFDQYVTEAETDAAWPSTDEGRGDVNRSNDNIDYDVIRDTSNDTLQHDLGFTISDSAWVLRFKHNITTITKGTGAQQLIYLGSDTGSSSVSMDALGLYINGDTTSQFGTLFADGAAPEASLTNDQVVTLAASDLRYFEIKRTSTTNLSIEWFSDSNFSTSLGSFNKTIGAGIVGLQHIKITNIEDTNFSGQIIGTIDNIEFYDGITDVNSKREASKLSQIKKAITETLNIVEAVGRFISGGVAIFRAITETLELPEVVGKLNQIKKAVGEVLSIPEVVNRFRTVARAITETLNLVENIGKLNAIKKAIGEVLTLVENVVRQKGITRAITETLNLVEVVGKLSNIFKSVAEVLTIVEVSNRFRTVARAVSEVLSIPEVANRFRTVARAITETLNLVEVVGKLNQIKKAITDVLNLVENVDRAKGIVRAITETLNLVEVVGKLSAIKKAITETLTILELEFRFRTMARAISEVLSISEVPNRFRKMLRATTETLNLVEVVARVTGLLAAITETLALVENVARQKGITRAVSEALNLVEFVGKLSQIKKAINETLTIPEVTNRFRTMARSVSEVLSIPEVSARVIGLFKAIQETLTLVENVAAFVVLAAITRAVNEVISIPENVARSRVLNKAISEILSIPEVVARSRVMNRAVSEVLNLVENVQRVLPIFKAVTEALSIVENAVKQSGFVKAVNEVLGFLENIGQKLTFVAPKAPGGGGSISRFQTLRITERIPLLPEEDIQRPEQFKIEVLKLDFASLTFNILIDKIKQIAIIKFSILKDIASSLIPIRIVKPIIKLDTEFAAIVGLIGRIAAHLNLKSNKIDISSIELKTSVNKMIKTSPNKLILLTAELSSTYDDLDKELKDVSITITKDNELYKESSPKKIGKKYIGKVFFGKHAEMGEYKALWKFNFGDETIEQEDTILLYKPIEVSTDVIEPSKNDEHGELPEDIRTRLVERDED